MSKTPIQPSINLKLSEALKEKINHKAHLKQQTVSKYIRELLSTYFDGTLCKGEIAKNARKEFINSTEFLQLVVWMYSKQKSKDFKEKIEELEGYVKTLKKAEEHLPKGLALEFDKVLFDVLRVKNENLKYSAGYKFTDGYSSTPEFNFELLEKYLLNYEKPMIVPSFKGISFPKKQ